MPCTLVGCHLLCSGLCLARGVVLQLFVQTYHRLLPAFWHFYNQCFCPFSWRHCGAGKLQCWISRCWLTRRAGQNHTCIRTYRLYIIYTVLLAGYYHTTYRVYIVYTVFLAGNCHTYGHIQCARLRFWHQPYNLEIVHLLTGARTGVWMGSSGWYEVWMHFSWRRGTAGMRSQLGTWRRWE